MTPRSCALLAWALVGCGTEPKRDPPAPSETGTSFTPPDLTDTGDDTEIVDTVDTDSDDSGHSGDTETGVTGETAPPEPRTCAPLAVARVQELDLDALVPEVIGDLPVEHGPGVALGDLDGDGDLDALMAIRGARLVVLLNDGTGALEIAAGWTVDGGALPEASAVALADVDGDGDLDVALGRAEGLPDLVLRTVSPGVWESEALPASSGERLTPTFFDADGDGWLDLFVGAYVHTFDPEVVVSSDGTGLYLNQGGARFVDATDRLPQRARDALAFHAAPIDGDGDGDLDLFLSTDCYASGACEIPPMFLVNDGTGRFTEREDCYCDEPISAMGASVGDANGDGIADLYVTNFGPSRMYLGAGDGSFIEGRDALGLSPIDGASFIGWGSRFVDLDLDGDDELYLTTGGTLPYYVGSDTLAVLPGAVFRDDGPAFTDITPELKLLELLVGRGVASGDLDGDGRDELVLVGHIELDVLQFSGGCPPGITLHLDAGPGNPQGHGAVVRTTVDGVTNTRFVEPSGTFSSSSPTLHLGTGEAWAADVIEVTWPGGAVTTAHDVAAGTTLTLTP